MSTGGSMFPYLSDFVPTQLLSLLGLIKWIIGSLIVRFSLDIFDAVGPLGIFMFTSAYSFLAAIIFISLGVETVGKSDY